MMHRYLNDMVPTFVFASGSLIGTVLWFIAKVFNRWADKL